MMSKTVSFVSSNDYTVSVTHADVAAIADPHPCDITYIGCTRIHLRGGQTLYVYLDSNKVREALGWSQVIK